MRRRGRVGELTSSLRGWFSLRRPDRWGAASVATPPVCSRRNGSPSDIGPHTIPTASNCLSPEYVGVILVKWVFDIADDRLQQVGDGHQPDHVAVFDDEGDFLPFGLELIDRVAHVGVR